MARGVYTPEAVEAARALQPIWAQPSERFAGFEDFAAQSQQRFEPLLSDIGLAAEEGVGVSR